MLIGEVAARSGVSARMLRHYDRIGLVSPTDRTNGGYRDYSEDDVRRLFHVEGLRTLGLGLQEIADALDGLAFSPTELIDDLISRTSDRLAQDTELLRNLGQVQASEPARWSDVLRTIGLMRGLGAQSASERQRTALAINKGNEPDIAPLVEATLAETDANAAGAMDWAIAQGGDAAVQLLVEALDSPIDSRRHRALEALRKIGSPRASGALAAAVHHPDPAVRAQASFARGRRGDTAAIPVLVALVLEGRDDVEASDVLAELAARQDCANEIVGIIAQKLANASDAERQRLTASLADIPGPASDAVLGNLLDDPDRRVTLIATYLLRSRRQSS